MYYIHTFTKLAIPIAATISLALASPRPENTAPSNNVIDCLTTLQVPFEDSNSANWTAMITPYNLRLFWHPAVVTLPYTSVDVINSIICAGAAGLKVQAKSGGHSYASYSSGGKDGSMIVNLQNLHSISVDKDTGIATVGAGTRLGNLALEIYRETKRGLPLGTCPSVGIGGQLTHGGYGHSSRLWGLSLDMIVGLDVVLASGKIVHTSETEFPDIFFAMRGAADSFGIVVNFYLRTQPTPPFVVNFSVSLEAALRDVTTITKAMLKLQATVSDPKYVDGHLSFGIYTNHEGALTIGGWCIECDLLEFNTVTLPKLLEGFPAPTKKSVESLGWIDSVLHLTNGEPLEVPLYGYDAHDTFYTKSIVTTETNPLTEAQWRSFWSFTMNEGRKSPVPWYIIINLYGGAGSQINVPSVDSSAYSDRDALWVFQNYGYSKPPFPASGIPFMNDLTDSLSNGQPADFGIYLNYVDPELTPLEVARLAYTPKTYDKLLRIKTAIDPTHMFWNPQSIGSDTAL